MELVDFNVHLESATDPKYRTVRYTAEFINGSGARVVLQKTAQMEAGFLSDPYSAAWLLSHIIGDFMSEISAG